MPQPTLYELSGVDPGTVAVECGERQLSWAELDDRTVKIAHGLVGLGATEGSHVAICVSNRNEFVETLIGAWRAGCSYTPLKTGWTESEIGVVLDDAKTAVVITDRDGARQAASKRKIATLDIDEVNGRYDEWVASQSREPLAIEGCGYKLPYTSGTTGRPKGVVMTGSGATPFATGWAGLARWAAALSLPGDGVHLFASRLFNGAPQTFGFATMARGATMRILPRWDGTIGLQELSRPDVTSTILVPTMMRQLLALTDVDRTRRPNRNLQTIVHGGEPCPVPVKAAMSQWWGEVLVEYYGFTEGGFTIAGPSDWRERPGTVGKPLPGMRVKVVGETGDELPVGETGTVFFEMAAGRRFRYLGDDDKTEAAHAGGGDAFSVGDIGHIDQDGYLFLEGRSADLIITAGVNVYPAEIEQALTDIDGIVDLCAYAIPDDVKGETVALAIVQNSTIATDSVIAAINAAAVERLAPYKRPVSVTVTDSLPRDETGKLLRRLVPGHILAHVMESR